MLPSHLPNEHLTLSWKSDQWNGSLKANYTSENIENEQLGRHLPRGAHAASSIQVSVRIWLMLIYWHWTLHFNKLNYLFDYVITFCFCHNCPYTLPYTVKTIEYYRVTDTTILLVRLFSTITSSTRDKSRLPHWSNRQLPLIMMSFTS